MASSSGKIICEILNCMLFSFAVNREQRSPSLERPNSKETNMIIHNIKH